MDFTPMPGAAGEREAVARAIEIADAHPSHQQDHAADNMPDDISDWGIYLADAAISALAPIRAAEILAAEANERARIVAWLRDKALAAWMRKTQTTIDPMTYLADAIDRNEHGAGK